MAAVNRLTFVVLCFVSTLSELKAQQNIVSSPHWASFAADVFQKTQIPLSEITRLAITGDANIMRLWQSHIANINSQNGASQPSSTQPELPNLSVEQASYQFTNNQQQAAQQQQNQQLLGTVANLIDRINLQSNQQSQPRHTQSNPQTTANQNPTDLSSLLQRFSQPSPAQTPGNQDLAALIAQLTSTGTSNQVGNSNPTESSNSNQNSQTNAVQNNPNSLQNIVSQYNQIVGQTQASGGNSNYINSAKPSPLFDQLVQQIISTSGNSQTPQVSTSPDAGASQPVSSTSNEPALSIQEELRKYFPGFVDLFPSTSSNSGSGTSGTTSGATSGTTNGAGSAPSNTVQADPNQVRESIFDALLFGNPSSNSAPGNSAPANSGSGNGNTANTNSGNTPNTSNQPSFLDLFATGGSRQTGLNGITQRLGRTMVCRLLAEALELDLASPLPVNCINFLPMQGSRRSEMMRSMCLLSCMG